MFKLQDDSACTCLLKKIRVSKHIDTGMFWFIKCKVSFVNVIFVVNNLQLFLSLLVILAALMPMLKTSRVTWKPDVCLERPKRKLTPNCVDALSSLSLRWLHTQSVSLCRLYISNSEDADQTAWMPVWSEFSLVAYMYVISHLLSRCSCNDREFLHLLHNQPGLLISLNAGNCSWLFGQFSNLIFWTVLSAF